MLRWLYALLIKLRRLKFAKGCRVMRGDERNRHRGAESWLFVVDARGEALVKKRRYRLVPGSLIIIERSARQEIKNTAHARGASDLRSPPA